MTVPSTPPIDAFDTTRVLTVPNLLSFVRLAGIPVFLWCLLGPEWDAIAVGILAVAGVTDFLDGFLARTWKQVSRLGQVLDPIADRLYILAIIFGLAARGILPWALVIVLVARDLMLSTLIPALRARGYASLPVHFLGKIATFCLLYAFPIVLLGQLGVTGALYFTTFGWAVVLWGTFFYWWAAILYMYQGIWFIKNTPRARVGEKHLDAG
ncbi:MAG: CDP-alcohol phosphatidyltransferase family protein [Propionibacteriaceae bacterium]|jgi:cardiolipin synthase|nr:CDP-alcohol phosphatidyltransferase family protein [Propionibacteriaceae bacterium]